jgi:polyisoprenoid-binding protein YceI
MTSLLLALTLAAGAPVGEAYVVDPGASTLRFHVVHKLHRVDGTSTRMEGKALVQPDGRVLAMVRVPVGSFDSGDGNRDEHMQEVLETAKFPFVVFKGIARLPSGVHAASARPESVPVRVEGELELHGVKQALAAPVRVEFRPDGTARVVGSFEVSLDAHRIERPSLLFVKIDDACRIDLDLVLKEVKP